MSVVPVKPKKIDNSAHLGGFIVGILIAAIIIGRNSAESKFAKYSTKAMALLAAYFVITSIVLATMKSEGEYYSRGCSKAWTIW